MGFSSLIGILVAIWSGTIAGELLALSIAIFSTVLGSLPNPHRVASKLVIGVACGVIAASIYRIGVQPHVDGWFVLVLSLVPFLAIGALARVHPKLQVYALDANMCFMLASQAGGMIALPADIGIQGVCMLIGAAGIATLYLLLPRPGPRLIAATVRDFRTDLDALLSGNTQLAERWDNVASRRLVMLAANRNRAGAESELPFGMLEAIGFGAAINGLRNDGVTMGDDQQIMQVMREALRMNDHERLQRLASSLGDNPAALAVRDAAYALSACAPLFEWAEKQPVGAFDTAA